MIRIGRKTFVDGSVIHCNGYKVFHDCGSYVVHDNNGYIDVGGIWTLEDLLKWCMEQSNANP